MKIRLLNVRFCTKYTKLSKINKASFQKKYSLTWNDVTLINNHFMEQKKTAAHKYTFIQLELHRAMARKINLLDWVETEK